MTRRTRAFLFASGLIVAIGLGTGLVAVYSGGLLDNRTQALSEFSYVPSDATVLAYANVRHIMASEFRQRLRSVLPDTREKDRLLAETGIDIERDIETVVAGFSPATGERPTPVAILRGRFDATRIEKVAVSHGAAVEDYRGRRLLRAPVGDGPRESGERSQQPAIAFLESNLVALGDLDAVKRAIDTAERRDTVRSNTELMAFVDDVAKSSHAWVAGRADAVGDHESFPEAIREPLGTIQWFALGAGIDRTVTGRLRAEARDPKAGEELRNMVNGALSMARMMAGKDARWSGLLDSVQATGTGSAMELSFTVPPEALTYMGDAAADHLPTPR
jgi:hypothetical protein